MAILIVLLAIFVSGYIWKQPIDMAPAVHYSSGNPCQEMDKDNPKIRYLELLEYMDRGVKKELRIIELVAGEWEKMATLFGYDDKQIKKNNVGDSEGCCREVLKKWLAGGAPGYPPTWNGLIEVVKDMRMIRVAKTIEIALFCAFIYE